MRHSDRQPTTNDMVVHNVALHNGRFDGADFTPPCDNNQWAANRFQTVNQPCVAVHGGTGTVQVVVVTDVSGASGEKTLSPSFSGPLSSVNASGFTVYSDSSCTTLVGTGQSATVGADGTPVISLERGAANVHR